MKIAIAAVLAIAAASGVASVAPAQEGGARSSAGPPKKVLVELYSSQGCDSCPPANDFLGQLAKQGYGPDKIVPIAFHVDYFNEPWVDPFSNKEYSRRQLAYNSALKRNDLYFTPMMMVDGRYPMLGSNRTEAIASIGKALKDEPGASLRLDLTGDGLERTLDVGVTPLKARLDGRSLMIGVAVAEGPVTTRVGSGENAGKTLVEHHAVRSFAYKAAKLGRSGSKSFTFPLRLAPGWVVANSIPWAPEPVERR